MAVTEISLNLLRAFDAAARQASFTEAAKELFVTQAAVSHQIKALETWLGKSLFHRTSRGLVLTDEGLLLAPTVADALSRIEEGIDRVRLGVARDVLTVGVVGRSEEHTSELQSLMRISYAVFCLKKKTQKNRKKHV